VTLHTLLYHAPLVGASTDIGYQFSEGTSLEIFEGCNLKLGDIHKRYGILS
jgi:hypothetical protein